MTKNIKRLIIVELIILLLTVIAVINYSNLVFKSYEKNLMKNNAIIITAIMKTHPELKDELIKNMILKKDIDESLIREMGLDYNYFKFDDFHNELKINFYRSNLIIIFSGIFLLGLTFIIYIYIQNKKIKEISGYLGNILNNNYTFDIRDYDEGVLSLLKNEIYEVTIKLKEQNSSFKKDREYLKDTLSDISHQLKTPLTSMYVINDILAGELDDETKKAFLNKNKHQLERIEWLVSSLLKMSLLDSGSALLVRKNIKVIDLINNALKPLLIPIELKNIEIIINCDKKIKINTDLNWMSEALINILKNAYEHTKDLIKIEVLDNPIFIEIKIFDNGCGIKKADINHVFERFYRTNSSKESIGIGLNMSKKIIESLDGEIKVISTENESTEFSIKMYKSII